MLQESLSTLNLLVGEIERSKLLTMNKSKFLFLNVFVFFLCIAHSGYAKEANTLSLNAAKRKAGCYRVSKSYLLTKAMHGLDGELQLLQDSRLTKEAYNDQLGTAYYTNYIYDDNQPTVFKDSPPLGTVLRILSRYKSYLIIQESHNYDHVPVGMLEEVRLSGGKKPTYLLTLDESVGMGSYNGLMTYFYEFVDGKLKDLEYTDNKTKKRERIILMRSLKTNWKLIKSKDGKSKDILHIACRPDYKSPKPKNDDGMEFLVSYARFHFNGKRWVKYERVVKGFWESENDAEDFSSFSKFPVVQ